MYEFDFKTLLQTIKERKRFILLNTIIALLIGVGISYSIPKVYRSEIRVVTEAQKSNSLSGSMGTIASLAGINTGKSEDAISPELYPDVVATNKFLVAMLQTPIKTNAGKSYSSYADYTEHEDKMPWWSRAIGGSIKAVKKLIGSNNPTKASIQQHTNPNKLTPAQEALVQGMQQTVSCTIDKETQVITLTATAQDPFVAKQLADTACHHLQNFISAYRTSKARTDLRYFRKLEKQLQAKYKAAQERYAKYSDSHQDLALKSFTTEETDLENAMQAAYTAYAQIQQQVGTAEGRVQEQTPVFTVVEDSFVANKPIAPKKMMITAAFTLLGLFGSLIWTYLRLLFSK